MSRPWPPDPRGLDSLGNSKKALPAPKRGVASGVAGRSGVESPSKPVLRTPPSSVSQKPPSRLPGLPGPSPKPPTPPAISGLSRRPASGASKAGTSGHCLRREGAERGRDGRNGRNGWAVQRWATLLRSSSQFIFETTSKAICRTWHSKPSAIGLMVRESETCRVPAKVVPFNRSGQHSMCPVRPIRRPRRRGPPPVAAPLAHRARSVRPSYACLQATFPCRNVEGVKVIERTSPQKTFCSVKRVFKKQLGRTARKAERAQA